MSKISKKWIVAVVIGIALMPLLFLSFHKPPETPTVQQKENSLPERWKAEIEKYNYSPRSQDIHSDEWKQWEIDREKYTYLSQALAIHQSIGKKENLLGGPSGKNELILAVFNRDLDKVKILIKNGMNVNQADPAGRTPLMFASNSGQMQVVEYLVKAGANLNDATPRPEDMHEAEDYNWTALMGAVQQGNVEISKYLLLKGADEKMEWHSWDGDYSMLMLAALGGSEELVNIFLGKGINVNRELGESPLTCAVRADNLKVSQLLLDKGAEVNFFKNEERTTPLIYAVLNNNVDMVKLLLERGANPALVTNEYGKSAIRVANIIGNAEIIRLLSK